MTARDRTRTELEREFARREVPEDAAAEVLERFDDLGLIDDQAFARRWVDSRRERRGLSRSVLQRELLSKGIDRETVQQATAQIGTDEELATACEVARRKVRSMSSLDPAVRRRRLAGMLARRGFASTVVAEAVRTTLGESLGEGFHPDDAG